MNSSKGLLRSLSNPQYLIPLLVQPTGLRSTLVNPGLPSIGTTGFRHPISLPLIITVTGSYSERIFQDIIQTAKLVLYIKKLQI